MVISGGWASDMCTEVGSGRNGGDGSGVYAGTAAMPGYDYGNMLSAESMYSMVSGGGMRLAFHCLKVPLARSVEASRARCTASLPRHLTCRGMSGGDVRSHSVAHNGLGSELSLHTLMREATLLLDGQCDFGSAGIFAKEAGSLLKPEKGVLTALCGHAANGAQLGS